VLFRKTLEDPEEDVCFYTIVALTHFVRRYVGGGVILQERSPLMSQGRDTAATSIADPGCLSISGPGSREKKIPDPESASKN
jgi:hypothetical protein